MNQFVMAMTSATRLLAAGIISLCILYQCTATTDEGTCESVDECSDEDTLVRPTGDHESRTHPRHFPKQGLGETIDISKDFDNTRFNTLCTSDTSLVAVLVIHSATREFARRKAVRETLRKECELRKCKIFFVVGIDKNETVYKQIVNEYKQENDILIVPKEDTYRNINNKVYATMEWMVQYCTAPKYVIQLDDDVFINLGYFLRMLKKVGDKHLIHCFRIKKAKPFRRSKWAVLEEEYPYQYYPEFCLGAIYGFPNVLSNILFDAIHEAEFVWMEDVWFTGLVRLKTDIQLQQIRTNLNQYFDREPTVDTATAINLVLDQNMAFLHPIEIEEYYTLYNVSMDALLNQI